MALRNEHETFDLLINPHAKHKYNIDLTQYPSLQKHVNLLKDLDQTRQNLAKKNIQPVIGQISESISRHSRLLSPILGFSTAFVLEHIQTDGFFRETITRKLDSISEAISSTSRFALVLLFVNQCYELFSIRKSIQQAMAVITDQEVKQNFEQIGKSIDKLKHIADEVDQLIQLYEHYDNVEEKDRLWRLIVDKLKNAAKDEHKKEAIEAIDDLQTKTETQKKILEKANAEAVTCAMFSLFGLLGLVLVKLIPLVGAITSVVASFFLAGSLFYYSKIQSRLNKIKEQFELLVQCQTELEEVLKRIEEQERWMNETDLKENRKTIRRNNAFVGDRSRATRSIRSLIDEFEFNCRLNC